MRRWPARTWLAGAMALLAALAALWLIGLWRFASSLPTEVGDPARQTDAIVVLTGGSLRVASGLQLLAEGKAKKLFISGVDRSVDEAELLRVSGQSPDRVACCVALGHAADNTAGNALETAAWMTEQGFHSLRLVTASYHMKRSLLEFTRAMPRIEIVPNPVFPKILGERPWWSSRAGVSLLAGEYGKYLFALMRPMLPTAMATQGAPE